MTKDDFIIIEHLISLKEMGMVEKGELKRVITSYIDPGFSMCMTCDPQIRQAWKRLGNWWEQRRDDFYKNLFIEKETTTKKKSKK
jgi:hypothetical protein